MDRRLRTAHRHAVGRGWQCKTDNEDVRRGLQLPYLRLSDWAGRVHKQSDQFGLRQQVVHELQSFFG